MENARCPLLKLPGELRNRIYDDLLTGEAFSPKQDAYSHPNRQRLIHTRRKDPSTTFGLTQTCYQLRKEFFPLHRAAFPSYRTIIPLEWLREGLDTFRYDQAGNLMTPDACIRVRLPKTSGALGTIDLKDLILSSTIEGFTFKLHSYGFSPDPFFDLPKDLLLRADAYPRWLRYIESRASQVFIQRPGGTGCYQIFITLEARNMESWMFKRNIPLNDSRLLRWRTELGLSAHLRIFPVGADPTVYSSTRALSALRLT